MNWRRTCATLVPFMLGGLAAAGVVVAAGEEPSGRTPDPPAQQMQVGGFDWRTNPIGPGAERTSELPPSIEDLPFEPLLPTMADDSATIQTVWTRVETEPAIAVMLQSGVFIMESAAEPIDFPTNEFYVNLMDGVPGASTTAINGAPAMAIQSAVELGNPSSVDVILEGVRISMIGHVGQDASELIALASTIPASEAGRPIKLNKS